MPSSWRISLKPALDQDDLSLVLGNDMISLESSEAHTSFLHLPNEILRKIFNGITDKQDIYRVGLVCRRLNAIMLPNLLQLHNIPNPERFIEIYVHERPSSKFDVLSALQLSFDITTINTIVFHLELSGSLMLYPKNSLTRKLTRVSRLVQRLQSVQNVRIVIGNIPPPYPLELRLSERLKRTRLGPLGVPDDVLREWSDSLENLLNPILTKGCTSLTVRYGTYTCQEPYRFETSTTIFKPLALARSFHFKSIQNSSQKEGLSLKGPGWEFHRQIPDSVLHVHPKEAQNITIALSDMAQNLAVLTTFSIQSILLIQPPLLRWTISVLDTCTSITCLIFAHISASGRFWEAILDCIGATAIHKNLNEFLVLESCHGLEEETLVNFISCLSALQRLYIDGASRLKIKPGPTNSSRSRLVNLPYLVDMHASVYIISHVFNFTSTILGSLRNAEWNHFPSLQSITTYPCDALLEPEGYSYSAKILCPLLERIQGYYPSKDVQFSMDLQGYTCRPERLQTTVDELDEKHGRGPDAVLFIRITKVTLDRFDIRSDNISALCSLLNAVFPALAEIMITTPIMPIITRPSPRQEEDLLRSSVDRLTFNLRSTLPNVKQLTLETRSSSERDSQKLAWIHMCPKTELTSNGVKVFLL
ncbi:hypothetical protein BDQ12DRAFT_687766 [Crucibulum laeve]|uniref:F-box domain-containing protein n=1 Tax=Crucibulum laeve TaxID=68775 RepID=A0A5C3LR83_9AGAR|nr:hypothetical protein BDQ12DRAFT_687766 [Crucibulum laeve]